MPRRKRLQDCNDGKSVFGRWHENFDTLSETLPILPLVILLPISLLQLLPSQSQLP